MNTIVEQIIRTFALAVVPPCIIDQQDSVWFGLRLTSSQGRSG
jgi:hypothetical protein